MISGSNLQWFKKNSVNLTLRKSREEFAGGEKRDN